MKKSIIYSIQHYFFIIGLLAFVTTGFAQTEAVPKNQVTINPFGVLRPYNPFVQIAYQRKITNTFQVKLAYDHIVKHSFLDLIDHSDDLKSANSRKGYGLSVELIKTNNKASLKKDHYFSVGFFYRKVSSEIAVESDTKLPTAGPRDAEYGYSTPNGCAFFCLTSWSRPTLDRFAHHKQDLGVNVFFHQRLFTGKRKRLIFDFQFGVGLFYRDAFYEGRDFENFKYTIDKIYLADGQKLLLHLPCTINFGYRF